MVNNEYSQQPIMRLGLGIALTFGVLLFVAFYIPIQTILISEKSTHTLITLFTKFFLVYLFMSLIFLGVCLSKGVNYLKCKKPKSILLLSILGTTSLWFYSFSDIGPKTLLNAMLFSSYVFWGAVIFYILKVTPNKFSLIGIFLGWGGLAVIYFMNRSSLIGGEFGILSGITLVIVVILTGFMIKKESPLRIAFYYSLIGFILSGIVLFFLETKAPVLTLPSLNLVTIMSISAIFFSIVLFCFLTSFYYTEAFIILAFTAFYPMFTITIDLMLNK